MVGATLAVALVLNNALVSNNRSDYEGPFLTYITDVFA